MVAVDFSTVKSQNVIDDGDYDAEFSKWNYVATSKNGNPYYSLHFTITEEGSDFYGRSLSRNYALTPKALWAFEAVLMTLGTDKADLEGTFEGDDLLDAVQGAACKISVGTREYTDHKGTRMVADITKISPTW